MMTEWLVARGLDPELAVRMGFKEGTAKDGSPVLIIPYTVDGKVATRQFRLMNAKEFRFETGANVALWNRDVLLDDALINEPLVIAEGAFDGLACIQAGYPRTVAVPGWSKKNFDPERYEPFLQNEQFIKERAEVIIVPQHADDAGKAMVRGVSNFFDQQDVRYVTWPAGAGDANDVLQHFDADTLREVLARARSYDVPGGVISGLSDAPIEEPRAIWKLDWEEFDKRLAFRSREISVLTGIPGAGKTTFMTWLCHRLAKVNDIRIGLMYFETEIRETERQMLRMNGCTNFVDEDAVKRVHEYCDRHYRFVHRIDDGDEGHGMMWVKRVIHKLAARDGCNIIVIDPWNEIEHEPEPNETVTQYSNVALKKLREWAAQYNIHIVLVAHPKKMIDSRIPTGYDIADTAAFANKVGMGYSVNVEFHKDYGEHVLLKTWKVRSREDTGCAPGSLRMEFLPSTMSYRVAPKRPQTFEQALSEALPDYALEEATSLAAEQKAVLPKSSV